MVATVIANGAAVWFIHGDQVFRYNPDEAAQLLHDGVRAVNAARPEWSAHLERQREDARREQEREDEWERKSKRRDSAQDGLLRSLAAAVAEYAVAVSAQDEPEAEPRSWPPPGFSAQDDVE